MKTKILHITNNASLVNGITSFLMELLPRLKKYTYEQEIIFFESKKDDEVLHHFAKNQIGFHFITEANYEISQNKIIRILLKLFMIGYLRKYRLLKKVILITNPDLIFFHGEEPELSRLFLKIGVPTINVPHSAVFFPTYPIQRLLLNSARKRFLLTVLFGERQKVIAHAKYRIIPNGIDNSKYVYIENKLTSTFNIGAIGRLSREKNIGLIIEVIEQLKNMKLKIKLKIAGEGNLKPELLNFVKNKNLTNEVEFLGVVKDKCDFYSQINLLVVMSIYEGMPITILEALSAGIPVITSNVGVIDSVIQTGINGFVINGWETKDFSNKIAELIKNPILFYELSKNTKKTSDNFSIDKTASEYYNMINELIDERD